MQKLKRWWLDKCFEAKMKLDIAREQLQEERGEVNIIAIILIVIVVIALVIIFRDAITGIVESLLERIRSSADAI